MAGGMTQSSSSSGIFFEGDGQSQVVGNYQLSSNFGNSSSSLPGHVQGNVGPVFRDVSNTVLNSVATSGPSVGASSLVTDANSGLSGGPHLQRSASINTESYMRLPASPMSFSSNNISISGTSVMDGSSVVQQNSSHDPGSHQAQQSQQHHGASSATSLPRRGQVQFHGGARVGCSLVQEPAISQLQKKPRLDIKQEDIVEQQVWQQLMQRQDPMHLQNSHPQLQALIQQQRLMQQEHLLQSMPPIQRAQLMQQQQQLQLRQQLQVQGTPPASAVKRPVDGGVCSRRLLQYLYHQRQRPAENTIAYWRNFVAEYYSPRAKKRWCLSRYDNIGHHSLGVFPQAAMDVWQCDICGSKSGRGFEATFEVLPRLYEIKFGSGIIDDELLSLDWPREYRFPSGIMMLEHPKAVEHSVYEQLRVVREGQLRIFFTPDLKILSWEFCARRHEELLPRRLIAPQVNQLLQVAQKCQSTISERGADGVSQSDIQANSAMIVTAGRQLARSLELQSLNDLGFSKRYVRCLQIADVVNSMKDLMDFCKDQKKGPIDGLKGFPRCATATKVQMQKMQEMDQIGGLQGLPTDHNTLNKLMVLYPWLSSQMNNNQHVGGRGALNPSVLALTNYQNLTTRQNSMNSTNNSAQQQEEASSPFSSSSQVLSTPTAVSSGILPNSPIGGFPGCQASQQQLHSAYGNGLIQQSQLLSSQDNQTLQQQMLQQYLQNMSKKNNGGAFQQTVSVQNPGSSLSAGGFGFRNSPAASPAGNGLGVAQGQPPSRNHSFKAASSKSESPAPVGRVGFDQTDEMVSGIAHEFTANGFFNNDLDDTMNFSWKA